MVSKTQEKQRKNLESTKTSQSSLRSSSLSYKEPETMEELIHGIGGLQIGLKKGEKVTGTIVSLSPKEVLVDIGKKSFGIVANWELPQIKDYLATLKIGDKIEAVVVNPENEAGYTVLSVKKSSLEKRWERLKEAKEKGENIEVIGLEAAKGGLLVEWQSIRGFIPGTQFDSQYSGNPGLLIGKKIKVKVLEIDASLNRLVVSQKAAVLGITPLALQAKLKQIKPEDILKGKIIGFAPFGIFVDIDGVEGLVHISEIAWEKVEDPSSFYKVGEEVEVMVLEVNEKEGKLNLSIKRLTPDPWKNILDRYPPETQVKGKVVRIAPFGVFVNIEMGIEGLIHISKLPPEANFKVGEEIDCIVEKVDPVKRKMSLTLLPKEKPVGYR